jgi:hypothetical protein
MWRPHKNARDTGHVGSPSSNLSDRRDAGGDGEWLPSSLPQTSAPMGSRTLRRRRSWESSVSFASRRKFISTLIPSIMSSSRAPRRRRSAISSSAPSRYRENSRIAANRTRSDWNTVAQEIETVIYGESDEEEREYEGVSPEPRRIALINSTSSTNRRRSRNNYGMRLGRWRRKSSARSPTVNPPTVPVTHIEYNLFDDQQIARPNTTTSRRSTRASPIVIYGQKYRKSPESLFRPILIILSTTFVTLLVVRIVTNLLTSGVGMIIVIPLAGRFVHEVVTRPIRLVRVLHSSPVLFWGCFGAVFCSLRALWYHRFDHLLPLLSLLPTKSQETVSSFEWMGIVNMTSVLVESDSNSADASTYNHFVILWGLIRGVFYGVEVGSVWLAIFGDRSNPSPLTKSFLWRIWRPVRRCYQRAMVRSRNQRCLVERKDGNYRHRCAICLDCLNCLDSVKDDDHPIDQHADEAVEKPHVQCQLLPCLHRFHDDCVRHWLTIRHTCPVCRVPVQGMQSCD